MGCRRCFEDAIRKLKAEHRYVFAELEAELAKLCHNELD